MKFQLKNSVLRESLSNLTALDKSNRGRYQTVSSSLLFLNSFKKILLLPQLTASPHSPFPPQKIPFHGDDQEIRK